MGCLRNVGGLGKSLCSSKPVVCFCGASQKEYCMKNVHVYDIKSEDGQSLQDLIIPMDIDATWMDVFDKVQGAYFDNVESYSYSDV
jgi:hypothetical protein